MAFKQTRGQERELGKADSTREGDSESQSLTRLKQADVRESEGAIRASLDAAFEDLDRLELGPLAAPPESRPGAPDTDGSPRRPPPLPGSGKLKIPPFPNLRTTVSAVRRLTSVRPAAPAQPAVAEAPVQPLDPAAPLAARARRTRRRWPKLAVAVLVVTLASTGVYVSRLRPEHPTRVALSTLLERLEHPAR